MYIYNGKPFDITAAQLLNDVQYSPGWFFDADQRALNNIVSVPDPAPPAVSGDQVVTLVGFAYLAANDSWTPKWSIADKSADQVAADEAVLSDAIAAAVARCYVDTDAVTTDAVGNRIEEYRQAEEDARAFVAAGYQGDTTPYVSSYAQFNPTGKVQTNQWAAESIITNADAYRTAQTEMRAKRFEYQARMRAAATPAQLAADVDVWNKFIADTRSALGV